VLIRPASIADIPSILKLERQSGTAGHWTEEQYHQAFQPEGPTRLVLVAEDSQPPPAGSGAGGMTVGSPVGFLVALHLAPEWELENIVVETSARRKGLGTQLLDTFLNAAHETNSTSVFLEVRESNIVARTLYEAAGFRQTGRRESYYAEPSEDAILYCRILE
jgi:[ribosomal protein S18]-alanine N-acetyltransferase